MQIYQTLNGLTSSMTINADDLQNYIEFLNTFGVTNDTLLNMINEDLSNVISTDDYSSQVDLQNLGANFHYGTEDEILGIDLSKVNFNDLMDWLMINHPEIINSMLS